MLYAFARCFPGDLDALGADGKDGISSLLVS